MGFIVGNQLRQIRLFHADRIPEGDFGLMRFGWIADAVNRNPDFGFHYELYRPWRRYDALVFVKAMGARERALRDQARRAGCPVLFDANVNYYDHSGTFYYDGMAPSETQMREAEDMTRACDAVIADSRFIAGRCAPMNRKVRWIPDNVNMELVPPSRPLPRQGAKLNVSWCGQAVKLFELLAIEETLLQYRHRLRLTLVTNSLAALRVWKPDLRHRFEGLLQAVEHTLQPYTSVTGLLDIYASQPGICISPRFADNTYNLGHTEWKITLALACGRMALASPVPSYCDVASRARGAGVRICSTSAEWASALDRLLAGEVDWAAEEAGARRVVETFYATAVVARDHARFMDEVLS